MLLGSIMICPSHKIPDTLERPTTANSNGQNPPSLRIPYTSGATLQGFTQPMLNNQLQSTWMPSISVFSLGPPSSNKVNSSVRSIRLPATSHKGQLTDHSGCDEAATCTTFS